MARQFEIDIPDMSVRMNITGLEIDLIGYF